MKMRIALAVVLFAMVIPLIAEDTGGIGLIIIDRRTAVEPLRIGNVYQGSPAAKAGIKPQGYLIAVDGTNVISMSLTQALHMVRGRVGAPILMELADPKMSQTNKFKLRRAKIDWVKKDNLVVPEVTR